MNCSPDQATRELEIARNEIAHLHAERERYEETMKKAFMRGVCALNLEAMTMFREGEEGGRRPTPAATGINDKNGERRNEPFLIFIIVLRHNQLWSVTLYAIIKHENFARI